VFSYQKVIYGEDNRVEVAEFSNPLVRELSKSVAAQIDYRDLRIDSTGELYHLASKLLRYERGFCHDTPFLDQYSLAECSGFLVAPDLIVTAGHCVQEEQECENLRWVFDYVQPNDPSKNEITISKENVYSCAKKVAFELDSESKSDFAVIKLDREVLGREPLRFRTEGNIEINQSLYLIGHPTGLPMKVSDQSWVRDNNDPIFFRSNLDAFGGNSGSPVFNQATNLVEGILVRGEEDFFYDRKSGCYRNKVCQDFECVGEAATRITGLNLQKIILQNQ
jgi:hypothetical protein